METSGSSNSGRVFNRNIFSVIWEWKYRNHTICFILGVILSSLFWLRIGGEDRKGAEKTLKEERKKTEQLQKELTQAKTLRGKEDDFIEKVDDIKDKTETDRKKLYEEGNKNIKSTDNTTHSERQGFITEWAERAEDSLDLAKRKN